MKRFTLYVLLLFLLTPQPARGFDFWGWAKNINYSIYSADGLNITSQGTSSAVKLTDAFYDNYYFPLSQKAYTGKTGSWFASLKVPAYMKDKTIIGFMLMGQQMPEELINDGNLICVNAGIYLLYKPIDSLQVYASLGGTSHYISGTLGDLKPAWPGDPGYAYYDSLYDIHFIKPGTPLKFSGSSGINWGGWIFGAKYYLLKWLYIEGNYSVWPSGVVDNYEFSLGPVTVKNVNVGAIHISGKSMFSVGMGAGF